MIIDAHCHAGQGDGFTGPWDTSAPLDRYLLRAAEANIGFSVLLPAFHSNYRIANRELANIVGQSDGRFWAFAFVHSVRDAGRVRELVQTAVVDHGFCGIKVHRHDARLTREICEVAQRFALPVLYDAAGEITTVELAAEAYPNVSFVIPHLGSFADDWAAQRALIDVLVRRSNVFTDTAGVRRFDLLEEAVMRAGAHKVLFGSDGPWLHPGVELAKVHALHLPAKDEQRVLSGNWLRLTSRIRRWQARRAAIGANVSSNAPLCALWQ